MQLARAPPPSPNISADAIGMSTIENRCDDVRSDTRRTYWLPYMGCLPTCNDLAMNVLLLQVCLTE